MLRLLHVGLIVTEILAALASLASAAPLRAVITLPATAVAGDDILIETSQSTGDILRRHFKCEVMPAIGAVPIVPLQLPLVPSSNRVMVDTSASDISPRLRSYAGRYRVTVTLVDKEGWIEEATATITITSEGCPTLPLPPTIPPVVPPITPPIVPPVPPVIPPGVPPDISGLFGLAPKVRDAVIARVPIEAQVFAAPLGLVYRDAAQMVIDGKLTALNAASKLKAMNAAVLTTPESQAAWSDFSKWLATEMFGLAVKVDLTKASNVVQALAEISLGLSLAAAKNVEDSQ